ncbi:nematode resistance protein-like HSPRO2 [Beta vulgaris subsp. vulgaris]|uniref:nematode resistance protein-like HSPRO2 n=1 Tax=Beta vulgaris subsp. vulgaris TaxID=3555 RepID=UPI00054018FA|nr:nematode resistance protein-like HSPRO2 [Beta vulgaris subsp. vulgaris]
MVDFDCKTKMVQSTPNLTKKTPKRITSTPVISPVPVIAGELSPASESSCLAYESYLRLPELRELWSSKEFPGWKNESIIKPALQALEITFRFISIILSDARPYVNRREWNRRLESLTRDQVELISILCEDDETSGSAPIMDLTSSFGEVMSQTGSFTTEVWKHETTSVVCRSSEFSLLPRLATWHKSDEISSRIFYAVESAMKRCPYSLGLGEPNLDGKPNLDYDVVCRPTEIHALKKGTLDYIQNPENQILFTIHQIFESWVFCAKQLLIRVGERINKEEFNKVADDCWVLTRIWNILEEIENLHLLMDPDDFLHLKTQLRMKTTSDSETFCFRSRGLIEITKLSKDLRHKVPEILAVEVDPMGGPVIQESAMELYREKRKFEKIHVLQAFQGVESAVKGFFYNYKQLLVIMMGSLEAKANFAVIGGGSESSDLLAQIFLEPTYYPSLDGAKTFIGDFWDHDHTVVSGCDRKNRVAKN